MLINNIEKRLTKYAVKRTNDTKKLFLLYSVSIQNDKSESPTKIKTTKRKIERNIIFPDNELKSLNISCFELFMLETIGIKDKPIDPDMVLILEIKSCDVR